MVWIVYQQGVSPNQGCCAYRKPAPVGHLYSVWGSTPLSANRLARHAPPRPLSRRKRTTLESPAAVDAMQRTPSTDGPLDAESPPNRTAVEPSTTTAIPSGEPSALASTLADLRASAAARSSASRRALSASPAARAKTAAATTPSGTSAAAPTRSALAPLGPSRCDVAIATSDRLDDDSLNGHG
ncbi:hypothetical protein T492DRAFT_248012 [Pavlovales sp. CCMP2436]|nr:hypothetical protein T492DRAFT_248012 [Pavlovales sp. CCMP2436]